MQPEFKVCGDQRRRIAENSDLLALIERARAIVDRNLQRSIALQDQFDDELVIKIEPIALELQSVDAVAPEDLEHGERIFHVLAVQNIDQTRKA